MPTVNEVLGGLLAKGIANWKTTVSGLCGLVIAVLLAVAALPPKASAVVIAVALLRAVVAWVSLDAKPGDGSQNSGAPGQ